MQIETLNDAEAFIASQRQAGSQVFWDNYDIVVFKPNRGAEFSKFGSRVEGRWGYAYRSRVRRDGTWVIDPRNVVSNVQ